MKTNKIFIYTLIIFFIVSINSIYSFSVYLTSDTYSLVIKQTIFYIIGILCIFFLLKIRTDKLLKYSFFIYLFNVILLILVLIFGSEINGTRAWFKIPFFGSFQPSEFMKIGLILYISKIINASNIKYFKDEVAVIIKVIVATSIPSLITFLEPDTGAVLIYFLIALFMLFASDIRIRWFLFIGGFIIIFGISFLSLYLYKMDLFISIFGSNMFYRLDRIFDFLSSSGMQLENSMISIGSSGFFGNGISNILLYFPEGHTDFIFASFASIYGLVGMIILLSSIIIFDITILVTKTKKRIYNYIIVGFSGALIYQQIQNISMTIGLLPITGITLPFISYGGSSLISYMILLGIIIDIRNNNYKKKIGKNPIF